MSASHTDDAPRVRRIREEMRDGMYVMAFSCAASTLTAVVVVLVTRLAG